MSSYNQIALATAETPDSIDELAGFLEARLSHPVNPERLARMFEAQLQLRARQDLLAKSLLSHDLTRDAYLSRLNKAYREFLSLQLGELGPQDFEAVYGDEEWDVEGIIDPGIFLGGGMGDLAGG